MRNRAAATPSPFTMSINDKIECVMDSSSDSWSIGEEFSHLLAQPMSPRTIQPIEFPSTPPPTFPAHDDSGDDETPGVTPASSHHYHHSDDDSLMSSSSWSQHQLSSLVISVTNLDLEGLETDEWETTTLRTQDTDPSCAPSASLEESNKENLCPNVPFHNRPLHFETNIRRSSPWRQRQSAGALRPRAAAGAADHQPHHRRHGALHRRDSCNSLPSPKDLQFYSDEVDAKKPAVISKKRVLPSYLRHNALNATTAFR